MSLNELKDVTEVIGNIAKVIAIIVGGIWAYLLFIKKREKYPRAEITHKINHLKISDNKLLIHIIIIIQNRGEVLLNLKPLEVRLQQILPLPSNMSEELEEDKELVPKGESEIAWPLINSRELSWKQGLAEIEPGEIEQIHFDFVIDRSYRVIEVYSYAKNVSKGDKEIGWGCTSIYDIEKGEVINESCNRNTAERAKA